MVFGYGDYNPSFAITKKMLDLYYIDEFYGFIIYGPLGYGKSAYCLKATAEAYGIINDIVDGYNKKGEPYFYDWESMKKVLLFSPDEVIKHLLLMTERDVTAIWDDAGLWLYALEWTHPFIMAFSKYLNVARTDLGSILFNAPSPTMIIKKVRDMPQVRTVKIIKRDVDNPYNRYKQRIARGYLSWMSPDLKKSGVRGDFEDEFNAYLPDPIYEWYKPKRDKYARMAKIMILKQVKGVMVDNLGELPPEFDKLLEEVDKMDYKTQDLSAELLEALR